MRAVSMRGHRKHHLSVSFRFQNGKQLIFEKDNCALENNNLKPLSHDAGWNDVGWHNANIRTPQLDALARDGLELTSSYVAPICSP